MNLAQGRRDVSSDQIYIKYFFTEKNPGKLKYGAKWLGAHHIDYKNRVRLITPTMYPFDPIKEILLHPVFPMLLMIFMVFMDEVLRV